MQKIVGVKRSDDKNIYYFVDEQNLVQGDRVVADFEDFQTIGTVSKVGVTLGKDKASELKSIIRKATDADLKKYDAQKAKAKENLVKIKAKSLELGLMMKFVGAEYNIDGSKIMIVFSSEERVDFRQFLKELAGMLKTRIELKQIGQRDEVKVCGGVGPCGQPCCCARFLDDFEHVTVKMAKTQGLSLSPTKINGICGRLMCCLGYEAEFYEETLKKMPKIGTEIATPSGKGTVVYNDILRERVSVKRQAEGDTFVVEDFTLEELATGKKKPEIKEELEEVSEEKPEPVEKREKHEKNRNHEKREKPQSNQNKPVQKPENAENKPENGQKGEGKKPFFKHRKNKNKHFQKPEPKN